MQRDKKHLRGGPLFRRFYDGSSEEKKNTHRNFSTTLRPASRRAKKKEILNCSTGRPTEAPLFPGTTHEHTRCTSTRQRVPLSTETKLTKPKLAETGEEPRTNATNGKRTHGTRADPKTQLQTVRPHPPGQTERARAMSIHFILRRPPPLRGSEQEEAEERAGRRHIKTPFRTIHQLPEGGERESSSSRSLIPLLGCRERGEGKDNC